MRPFIRHGSIALALLALAGVVVGVASAVPAPAGTLTCRGRKRSRRRKRLRPRRRMNGCCRSPTRSAQTSVMQVPGVPVADVEPPDPTAALPVWVALQDLPSGVSQQIPMVEGYKFVKLEDWILIVQPASRTVVAQMPRYKLVLQ